MDTQAELDLQIAILLRAEKRNRATPTVENFRYLKHCRVAADAAYITNKKGN